MTISMIAAGKNVSDMAGKRQAGKLSIPEEVIEAILSKLPVKSLIRFKILSKLWKAIISNPRFSKINYNQTSHNLFLRFDPKVLNRFCLMRLELASGSLILQRELGDSPFGLAVPLCCCNGIVLLVPWKKPCYEFVLWNPSIRRYAIIPLPPAVKSADMPWINPGFYHDSTTDDYKVVIITTDKGSMVYSCKTRSWSEEELIPCDRSTVRGCPVDGCLYWATHDRKLLCFYFRERKTEELKLPDDLPAGQFELTTLWWGRLCVHAEDDDQLWIRENNGWREPTIMVLKRTRVQHVLLHEDKAVSVGSFTRFVVNNNREKSGVVYTDNRFKKLEISGVRCIELMPYSESLFFPLEAES